MKFFSLILMFLLFSNDLFSQNKETPLFPWLAQSGKSGYCDATGKLIIPPTFDTVGLFKDGYAIVGIKNKHGVIDESGKIIIPIKYSNIELFKEGSFLLSVLKKEHNSWIRFWNWKLLPDFNILSTSNSGPFLTTKVPRALWTIKYLPANQTLYTVNRSDADGGKYWKDGWSPENGIPRDFDITSAADILMVRHNLYRLNPDKKLEKISGNVLDIIDSTSVISFNNRGYYKLSLAGDVQSRENYDLVDGIKVNVDSDKSIEIKKQKSSQYPFQTISTDLFKDKNGKTYFFPDLTKPFPTNISDYKTENGIITAEEIMNNIIIAASIPDSRYFLIVSAFGNPRKKWTILLNTEGHWNTDIPAYDGFHKMLDNGEILFTRSEKKGILTKDLKFKTFPFDYDVYPLSFSSDMFIGKDIISEKYGIYNLLTEKWQVPPRYSSLYPATASGVAIYSLMEEISGVKKEKFGLLDIQENKFIIPALYDKITSDGFVYKNENGNLITFYINPFTGKEYRE
ncbi:WG repeat-containing protein [Chryseobacterium sp. M5A1_1a]